MGAEPHPLAQLPYASYDRQLPQASPLVLLSHWTRRHGMSCEAQVDSSSSASPCWLAACQLDSIGPHWHCQNITSPLSTLAPLG
jgi:hypothetical protein